MYRYSGAPYVADIGFSTAVGGDHASKGIPNQDAAYAAAVGPYVFGAVADGVGNTSVHDRSRSNSGDAPTASQLAVGAFSEAVSEFLGHHAEGTANLDWGLRIGLSAANIAVRRAVERRELPRGAATTFIAGAGSLVTGEMAGVSLGDSGLMRHTPDGYTNLVRAHTDEKGRLTKTLKGEPELRVPQIITVPAVAGLHELVGHTDGINDAYGKLHGLAPDLAHLPAFEHPNTLISRALGQTTAQRTAEALTGMATETMDRILMQGGMRPDSDDASAFVLRVRPL